MATFRSSWRAWRSSFGRTSRAFTPATRAGTSTVTSRRPGTPAATPMTTSRRWRTWGFRFPATRCMRWRGTATGPRSTASRIRMPISSSSMWPRAAPAIWANSSRIASTTGRSGTGGPCRGRCGAIQRAARSTRRATTAGSSATRRKRTGSSRRRCGCRASIGSHCALTTTRWSSVLRRDPVALFTRAATMATCSGSICPRSAPWCWASRGCIAGCARCRSDPARSSICFAARPT